MSPIDRYDILKEGNRLALIQVHHARLPWRSGANAGCAAVRSRPPATGAVLGPSETPGESASAGLAHGIWPVHPPPLSVGNNFLWSEIIEAELAALPTDDRDDRAIIDDDSRRQAHLDCLLRKQFASCNRRSFKPTPTCDSRSPCADNNLRSPIPSPLLHPTQDGSHTRPLPVGYPQRFWWCLCYGCTSSRHPAPPRQARVEQIWDVTLTKLARPLAVRYGTASRDSETARTASEG